MHDDERKVRALAARALDDLVTTLADANVRELEGRERAPSVTLHLRSGRDVTGVVLRELSDRQTSWVLVQTGKRSRHEPANDVTYVPLAAIEAITVHEAPSHLPLLAPGGASAQSVLAEPAPSKLDARRTVTQHGREASFHLGREIAWSAPNEPSEPESLRALVTFSSLVLEALKDAARDPMGKDAIGSKLREVVIADGPSCAARLDGDVLRCTATFAQGTRGQLSRHELKSRIESLF